MINARGVIALIPLLLILFALSVGGVVTVRVLSSEDSPSWTEKESLQGAGGAPFSPPSPNPKPAPETDQSLAEAPTPTPASAPTPESTPVPSPVLIPPSTPTSLPTPILTPAPEAVPLSVPTPTPESQPEVDQPLAETPPPPPPAPPPAVPEIVYPINGQTLDLDGAYLFKVELAENVSGYLFGFSQNGVLVYENFRDDGNLSENGEFAVLLSNPFHSKFKEGDVLVSIRALGGEQWSEARMITITLVGAAPVGNFFVKPYLIYPADKPMYPEYETAVNQYLAEMQDWYGSQVGKMFTLKPLQVVQSSFGYLTMRCGESPSQTCIDDPSKLESNWPVFMNKAIHNGVEQWEENTIALIFSAGGGGYAGGILYGNNIGFAITGDWVLEPISGVENTWGIPCSYSDGWQCAGGVPKGSPAHELGHAFGLPHPGEQYNGQTIMQWHGDYPGAGFIQQEIDFLLQSPFFQ